ncbi:hypothetical protein BU23DRAFT_585712 [Bimuria novae-zelandiae CBS 107.79]|uniref:Peptidase S8/S53 domain-containing protein n=1 Tax=Bimuria novae-zelandiae CBS 107.79 TaxID=1447943 RepID=A0A6A5UIJ3_9PLEO|nr:hypothetical protein BU23DRAFT_585712 [Bimuria novae-zelandiae CBS 107.79]
MSETASQPNAPKKRDADLPPGTKKYVAIPTDIYNDDQINKTRTWLEGLMKDKSKMFQVIDFPWETPADVPEDELLKLAQEGKLDEEFDNYRRVIRWSHLVLDSSGYEEVSKKQEWIKAIYEEEDMLGRHVSHLNGKTSRILIIEFRKDFVYEKRAGKGVAVYVIDSGVAVDAKNTYNGDRIFPGFGDEFPKDPFNPLTTQAFDMEGLDKRLDHSPDSHGTGVASKIVTPFGTAKEVTIVPVVINIDETDDTAVAFRRVFGDIARRRANIRRATGELEPQLKAVVVLPSGLTKTDENFGYTREEAENSERGKDLIQAMAGIFLYCVPIVCSAGNFALVNPRRAIIDVMPQVLESNYIPLINVGATTLEGKAADFSQAPAVAGIIPVHMNYEPWDESKRGVDRVKEIKKWLKTPESSWERMKNSNPAKPDMQVNMIWNGADQRAHESVHGTSAEPPPPEKEGSTLVVALEQIEAPRSIKLKGGNICDGPPDHYNRYFFYRLEGDETGGMLAAEGTTTRATFDNPTWPTGEWNLKLNNRDLVAEDYTYKNDGQSAGALWKGDRKIDCQGDLAKPG